MRFIQWEEIPKLKLTVFHQLFQRLPFKWCCCCWAEGLFSNLLSCFLHRRKFLVPRTPTTWQGSTASVPLLAQYSSNCLVLSPRTGRRPSRAYNFRAVSIILCTVSSSLVKNLNGPALPNTFIVTSKRLTSLAFTWFFRRKETSGDLGCLANRKRFGVADGLTGGTPEFFLGFDVPFLNCIRWSLVGMGCLGLGVPPFRPGSRTPWPGMAIIWKSSNTLRIRDF